MKGFWFSYLGGDGDVIDWHREHRGVKTKAVLFCFWRWAQGMSLGSYLLNSGHDV